MKRNQTKLAVITGALIVVATLIFYGCKKESTELAEGKHGYDYFQTIMSTDENIIQMQSNISDISRLTITEAYLKTPNGLNDNITSSLAPYLDNKIPLLEDAAKKIKTDQDFKVYLGKVGLKAQSENYLKEIKSHIESVKKFYDENPEFSNLSKEEQTKLLALGMIKARANKKGIFRQVQEEDPCWNTWSQAMQDAEDSLFWELAGYDIAFVLCCIGTEGIGAPACYAAYLALAALAQLHYIDNVNKADDRYNECVGDVTAT